MGKVIALVAGEASGDTLGAGLIQSLKQYYPDAQFVGIGGANMIAQGLDSWEAMERLSVMGLVEVLSRLPELLRLRSRLIKRLIALKPDVYIGIDSPDFNLPIAGVLKDAGIQTVHYVSPSIWAWRPKRVFKIVKAVDVMLTLLPFEAQAYQGHSIKAVYVGHTLADSIPVEETNASEHKRRFGLAETHQVVSLIPGSRSGEVKRMMPLFMQAAKLMSDQQPNLRFLVPAVNATRYQQILDVLALFPEMNARVTVEIGTLHSMVQASDAVLIASGTATLETLLLKKPMVVSYKVATLTACILKRQLLQPYISLPNILAGKKLVPELLQKAATPERLAKYVLNMLSSEASQTQLKIAYTHIHRQLKCNANEQAAKAVIELLNSPKNLSKC